MPVRRQDNILQSIRRQLRSLLPPCVSFVLPVGIVCRTGRHQRNFGLICQNNPLLHALTKQIAHHLVIVGDGNITVNIRYFRLVRNTFVNKGKKIGSGIEVGIDRLQRFLEGFTGNVVIRALVQVFVRDLDTIQLTAYFSGHILQGIEFMNGPQSIRFSFQTGQKEIVGSIVLAPSYVVDNLIEELVQVVYGPHGGGPLADRAVVGTPAPLGHQPELVVRIVRYGIIGCHIAEVPLLAGRQQRVPVKQDAFSIDVLGKTVFGIVRVVHRLQNITRSNCQRHKSDKE